MDTPEAVVASPREPLSFNLLMLTKRAQAQHGLRHADYTRYRQYCARRLRRLYKGLKFLHGRKKFEHKTLDEDLVEEVRHLYIPLMMSERAWAYAMEIKHELGQGGAARKRMHLLKRLRKASQHAAHLAKLCAATADGRTALEAEAYSQWMAATVLFEQEKDWEGALAKFMRTRTVYEQLSQLGDMEQQALCRERVEELEPTLRYCQYNLNQAGGTKVADLMDMSSNVPGQDLLNAKIQAVMAEERARAAEAMSEIQWQGQVLPVRNNNSRLCILNAQDIAAQIAQVTDYQQKDKLYDKVFMAYNDAKRHIRDDLSHLGGRNVQEEQLAAELNALDQAVTGMLVQQTLSRNKLLLENHQVQLEHQQEEREKSQQQQSKIKVRSEDLVKLCDNLLTNLSGLADSVSSAGGGGGSASNQCAVQEAMLLGWRAYYLGKMHIEQGNATEAYILLGKSAAHASNGLAQAASGDAGSAAELTRLRDQARSEKLRVHAESVANDALQSQGLQEGVNNMDIAHAAHLKAQRSPWLMQNLDNYAAFAGKKGEGVHLAQIPPPFQTLPAAPIVLDTAANEIQFPDLKPRMAAEQKSGISRFFGWGKK